MYHIIIHHKLYTYIARCIYSVCVVWVYTYIHYVFYSSYSFTWPACTHSYTRYTSINTHCSNYLLVGRVDREAPGQGRQAAQGERKQTGCRINEWVSDSMIYIYSVWYTWHIIQVLVLYTYEKYAVCRVKTIYDILYIHVLIPYGSRYQTLILTDHYS